MTETGDCDPGPDSQRSSMRRAAIASSVAGPFGVLVGLLTTLPMLPVTAAFVVVGALVAAFTCPEDPMHEAGVMAILPIGAWLVGAAVGWAALAMIADAYPGLERYAFVLTLLFSVLGGTLSVFVVITHFPRRPVQEE